MIFYGIVIWAMLKTGINLIQWLGVLAAILVPADRFYEMGSLLAVFIGFY